ncbi:MAG TPA: hypothetical protein PLU64_03545 [Saprospiraceae bacterium]|nr:hypothetical protein [Lewinellaceae bacterium]HQU58235.1 hypothetical protein [Saprospiraceae bacterium]
MINDNAPAHDIHPGINYQAAQKPRKVPRACAPFNRRATGNWAMISEKIVMIMKEGTA